MALGAQAVRGLLRALPSTPDDAADWESLPARAPPALSPGGSEGGAGEVRLWVKHSHGIAKLRAAVSVPAPLTAVADLLMDLNRWLHPPPPPPPGAPSLRQTEAHKGRTPPRADGAQAYLLVLLSLLCGARTVKELLPLTSALSSTRTTESESPSHGCRRAEWDPVLLGRSVRRVTDDIDIVWIATSPVAGTAAAAAAPWGASEDGGTDYALLRCRDALGDGRVAIALRSITCSHVPPTATHRRAELLPSGFLLTPEHGPGPCKSVGTVVEYMVQLDRTSAAHFDHELAGRSYLLRSSLCRLAVAPSLHATDSDTVRAASAGPAGPGAALAADDSGPPPPGRC